MKELIGFLVVLGIVLALYSLRGEGAEATHDYRVCWVKPTQRTDNSPLTNLAGYRISWQAGDSNQTSTRDVMDPAATCTTINLPRRTWYWSVDAVDSNGLRSEPSNIVVQYPPGDTDADGIEDYLDNCTLASNASQVDSDADGYGNRCDGDLNGDQATNAQDYTLFRLQLGLPSLAPVFNPADINANGVVNAQDYVMFRQLLGKPPGPSGWK